MRSSLLSITVGIAAACAPSAPRSITPADYPRTRPELTRYQETSHYADVRQFLDSLRAIGAPLTFGSIGKTTEGRDIPYVVASRPQVHTAAQAKALGRPIVYVQGNIHAGEVEGKDALLDRPVEFHLVRFLQALETNVADDADDLRQQAGAVVRAEKHLMSDRIFAGE